MQPESTHDQIVDEELRHLSALRKCGEISGVEYERLFADVLRHPVNTQPRRIAWEYCEAEIQLPHLSDHPKNRGEANLAVTRFLIRVGQDGWEPVDARDLGALWLGGRVRFRGFWLHRYVSATIRLRRPQSSR